MKYSTVFTVLIVAAAVLTGCSDAWKRKNRGLITSNETVRNRAKSNATYLLVRRVDEPHPYFRFLSLSSNSSNLSSLNSSLASFFNKSAADIELIVRNDKQLITSDWEVSKLKYKDQLEVTFKDSGAPTRSKTLYAYTKEVRQQRWSMKKEKKKSDKKARGERRRGPAASSPIADDVDEAMEDFEYF